MALVLHLSGTFYTLASGHSRVGKTIKDNKYFLKDIRQGNVLHERLSCVAELPDDKCCVLTMASIASVRCSGVTSSLELSTTKVHNIHLLLDESAYLGIF